MQAQQAYAQLAADGQGVTLWAEHLNRQIYLDDDEFVGRMQEAALPTAKRSAPVPKAQRSSTRSRADWLAPCGSRAQALHRAYTKSGLTMTAMAAELRLTVVRVSQLIAKAEKQTSPTDGPEQATST